MAPGDAKHRLETREDALLTMWVSNYREKIPCCAGGGTEAERPTAAGGRGTLPGGGATRGPGAGGAA